MLSTCQLTIPVHPPPSPASKISSLDIDDIVGTVLDFARIIRAFPALLDLRCRAQLKSVKDPDDDLQGFLASAPPAPRLLHLAIDMDGVRQDLEHILFPPEAQLRLRSLSVSHCTNACFWKSVVRRAGSQLEELSLASVGIVMADRECSISLSLLFRRLVLTRTLNTGSGTRSEHERSIEIDLSEAVMR